MRKAAIVRRADIIAGQVGAEKNKKKRMKMEVEANKFCDLLDDPTFWKNLQTVADDIEPICYITNINQGEKTWADQVLLGFAGVFLHFRRHADSRVADGMTKRLEKRWAAMDQDFFVIAMVLNPYERISRFGDQAGISVFTLRIVLMELGTSIAPVTTSAGKLAINPKNKAALRYNGLSENQQKALGSTTIEQILRPLSYALNFSPLLAFTAEKDLQNLHIDLNTQLQMRGLLSSRSGEALIYMEHILFSLIKATCVATRVDTVMKSDFKTLRDAMPSQSHADTALFTVDLQLPPRPQSPSYHPEPRMNIDYTTRGPLARALSQAPHNHGHPANTMMTLYSDLDPISQTELVGKKGLLRLDAPAPIAEPVPEKSSSGEKMEIDVLGSDQGTKHEPADLKEDITLLMESLAEHEVYQVKGRVFAEGDGSLTPDIISVGAQQLTDSSSNPLTEYNTMFSRLQFRLRLKPLVGGDSESEPLLSGDSSQLSTAPIPRPIPTVPHAAADTPENSDDEEDTEDNEQPSALEQIMNE
ncbi:hypothetical protein B0H10DRAFT_2214774 [Mycena sp. CBHHK59/15]|nr:hypothetical protein B0H10DRAFT_2214774 [Mycena sp. CBHHK59/15]